MPPAPQAVADQMEEVKSILQDAKAVLGDVKANVTRVEEVVGTMTAAIVPLKDALQTATPAEPAVEQEPVVGAESIVSADDEIIRLATAYRAAKKALDENTDESRKSELESQLATATTAYTDKGFDIANIDTAHPVEILGGRRRSRRSRRSRRLRRPRRSQISRRPRRPIRSRRSRRSRR